MWAIPVNMMRQSQHLVRISKIAERRSKYDAGVNRNVMEGPLVKCVEGVWGIIESHQLGLCRVPMIQDKIGGWDFLFFAFYSYAQHH